MHEAHQTGEGWLDECVGWCVVEGVSDVLTCSFTKTFTNQLLQPHLII